MFNLRRFTHFHIIKRLFSSKEPITIVLEKLKERSLLHVAGQDGADFLQGLITNDIHHLGQQSGGSMYTLFLNTKGRVLYDAIIYRTQESNGYLIECDRNAVGPIQKHLKMYRVRRKVDINSLDEEYKLYSLFDIKNLNVDKDNRTKQGNLEGAIVPCDELNSTLPETSTSIKMYKDLLIFKDPRVVELGSRVISKVDTNVKGQIKEILDVVDIPKEYENYKIFRYSLGVGEGLTDLPQGNCFPLECNCDYLHGISFHKGCYIGQELTARTHHTGVVRKRLMPLYFSKTPTKLPTDNIIMHEKFNLGRLRGIEGNVGLALLRIEKALDLGEFQVGNGIAKVKKPTWWPIETSKEKMNVERN